jgi:hypothetical protein
MWRPVVAALLLFALQATGVTGSVTGVVHDAGGAPEGGLVAVLFPADQTAWPEAGTRGLAKRAAVVAGRFEIADVPPGAYKFLVVNESALVDWPAPATLGQLSTSRALPLTLAGGTPTALDIEVSTSGAAPIMARVSVRTSRVAPAGADPSAPGRGPRPGPPPPTAPGAISGRVTDAEGHPLAGLEVRSVRRLTNNGASTLGNFGSPTVTDADGRYRLTNRQAGTDLIVVVAHAIAARGSAPAPVGPVPTGTTGPRLGLIATFYGDTSDERAATPVTVTTDERSGIDIQIRRVPIFVVTGSVARDVVPVRSGTFLSLVRIDTLGLRSSLDLQRAPLAPDGAFRFDDVPEGDYDLLFETFDGWGGSHVVVSGRDPDPIVLTPHLPMVVRGRVEFEGGTPPVLTPTNGSQFGVELAPAQLTVGSGFVRVPIQADGTFTARGMGAGPFRLRGTVPAPWFQVAGLVGGLDTMDLPLAAGPDADDAVLVFADRPTAFRVSVVDSQGQPVSGVVVVIFHEDPRYWPTVSRRVQFGVTLSNGSWGFSGLPPGRYFAATSPDVRLPLNGPQILIPRLKPSATPFDLAAGESRSVQLVVKR